MAVSVSCPACGHTLKIPDAVYERRVAGQVAVLKCKRCQGGIRVDGTVSPPKVEQARAKSIAPKSEAAKPEAAKPEAAKPEAAKPEAAKPEATQPEAAKPEATQPEAAKPEATKPEATKPEAAKPEAAKPEAAKAEPVRPAPTEEDLSWSIPAPPTGSGTAPSAPRADAKPAATKPAQAKAETPKPAQAKGKSPKAPAVAPRTDGAKAAPSARTDQKSGASIERPRWMVSYDDEEEDRKLDEAAIASELRRGAITAETIVWREGMGDWLPIAEVPELQALIAKAATPPAAPKPARPAPPPRRSVGSNPFADENEPDPGTAHESTHATSEEGYDVVTSVRAEMLGGDEAPAGQAPAPPPPRPPPVSAASNATSSDDDEPVSSVRPGMLEGTAAPAVPPAPAAPRISAPDNEAPPSLPSAAGISSPDNEAPPSLPSAAGISAPGLFGQPSPPAAADAAPLLPGPDALLSGLAGGETAHDAAPVSAPPQSRVMGNKWLWVLVAVAVVSVVVAVVLLLGMKHGAPAQPAVQPPAQPPSAAEALPSATEAPPPAATAPPSAAVAPPASVPEPAAAASENAPQPSATGSAGASGGDFFKQFAAAAQNDQPSPAQGGLDEKRALEALASRFKAAKSCRHKGDPSTATLQITLDPSGKVTKVAVSGPLAGKPTGRCIEKRVNGAHVPPFSGSAATITHALKIH